MLLTEAVPRSSAREWIDGTRHAAVMEAVRRPGVVTVRATPALMSALTSALGFLL